ncbi:MAG: signal peptidase II [Planctomycetaceae bacterium]|nr:signal peptidase II [Planctomycetaceae bacterium]
MSSAPKRSPADKDAASTSSAPRGGREASAAARLPVNLPVNRYVVFFAIAILGCTADLATKQATFSWLGLASHFVDDSDPANFARWRGDENLPHRWWLIDGRLGIETSVNTGALFGMAPGYWWLFATLSILAALGILTWLFVFKAAQDRWLNVALAAVTAGILGNLFDRLGLWDATGLASEYHHGVRDWILFRWPEIKWKIFNPWPNFNIADSLLVTGAIMLVVHAFVWREKKEETKEKGP